MYQKKILVTINMKGILEKQIKMYNLYISHHNFTLSFIHRLNNHFEYLKNNNYEFNKLDMLNMLPKPNFLNIKYNNFIKLNLWKKKYIFLLQNTGVEKISDLIWLYSNEFKFPKLDINLSFLNHYFTPTSFRHYSWKKVKLILPDCQINNKIVVSSLKSDKPLEKKFGLTIYLPVKDGLIISYGFILPKTYKIWINNSLIRQKYNEKKTKLKELHIDNKLIDQYLDNTSLAVILTQETNEFINYFLKTKELFNSSNTNTMFNFIKDLLPCEKKRIELITPETSRLRQLLKIEQNFISELYNSQDIRFFLLPSEIRNKALTRYKMSKAEDTKSLQFIEGLIKIPFNNFVKNKVYLDPKTYLEEVEKTLSDCIYGHQTAKKHILRIAANSYYNQNHCQIIFGICGPKGNGKTTLIKNGLANCFKTIDDEPRPSYFISLGGANQASFLKGHDSAYVGSSWGAIVNALITTQCMNPIIIFDELDKVSQTEYGKEIINVLIQITDTTQNFLFEDRFFQGIPIDLSKAIFVFSFNDITAINPILRDRIHVVNTDVLDIPSKIEICKKYFLPNSHYISDNNIRYIISHYTQEAGVRHLKQHVNTLCNEISLRKLSDQTECKRIHKTMIDNVLDTEKKFISLVPHKNTVGQIATLYRTKNGEGGIMLLQTTYTQEKSNQLTGNAGPVMMETFFCALTYVYSYLKKINKKLDNPIHTHIYPADGLKDGPSIGLAMVISLISLVLNKPIKGGLSCTGEIDLMGNIRPVGGINIKLMNAYYAQSKSVIIPEQNFTQITTTIKNKKMSIYCVKNIDQAIKIALEENFTITKNL